MGRSATVLVFLNTVKNGGHTVFPGARWRRDAATRELVEGVLRCPLPPPSSLLWATAGLPFRRSWLHWRFLQKRNPAMTEVQQLMDLGILHEYENAISLNPRKAIAGGVGCTRNRFCYLSEKEQKFLNLSHKTL